MRATSSTALFVATLLAATPLFAADTSGSKGFKCWTNSEGVRECGNAIPPEYAQQESSRVNARGITTETQSRALTAEEREAEAKRKQAEADRAAEEKRVQEERLKADQVLLQTFASEQDIVMARDRKISSLEGTIEITQLSINKQQKKVEEFRKRVAAIERSGKPVSPEMAADLATEQQKLDNKQAFVAAKRSEVQTLRAEYDAYLLRFRQLMQQRGQ